LGRKKKKKKKGWREKALELELGRSSFKISDMEGVM
jgi:hypothetical protein